LQPDRDITGQRPSRWIVAQEGSRQTYAVPISFHRLKMLRTFYVDTWCRRGRSLLQRGPRALRALATHFAPGLPQDRVVSFNCSVLCSRTLFYLRKQTLSSQALSSEYCRFGEKFASLVRDHLYFQELDSSSDLFFGFNTNCLEALHHLRDRGIFTVVDQVDPGKVEEDLCIEETEKWPGWARVPGRMSDAYWDRIKEEWRAADLVLVNSPWSAEALVQQGVARNKLIVVPLAIDASASHARPELSHLAPLKVLWLGSLILRKGIQYLVHAARLLEGKGVEFILAGPIGISEQAVSSFPTNMRLVGTVTRDRVRDLYEQAQVFVLPTLSDGFAITQLEAMAHGLPVVTTPNCGKVVTDGYDGFIVPASDAEALAEALARLRSKPALVRTMSANALETVRKFDLPSNASMIQQLVSERRRQIQLTALSHD
jgi:glycosyltransferase involved in cell wall biosynthesis